LPQPVPPGPGGSCAHGWLRVTVPKDAQREIIRLLYVSTRHQAKALSAVLELDGLE
jgi:hypothetical protein